MEEEESGRDGLDVLWILMSLFVEEVFWPRSKVQVQNGGI